MATLSFWRGYSTFALLLLLPVTGMAMTCKTQGAGEAAIYADLSSTVAIPATLPDGRAAWRSERHHLVVECSRERFGPAEDVVLYLNPDKQRIGEGIRAGITLNGVDYVHGSGPVATQHVLPACMEGVGNGPACPKAVFNLLFSVFIEKFGPTPPSGVASDLLDYRVFQIDSAQGMNPLPDNNLNYIINSLSGLRFVACNAELRVLPETVEFGIVPIQNVRAGEVATVRQFALATSRTCDSPYSLNARFTPVSGKLLGDVLVPVGNDSIGIRITRAPAHRPIRFNEPFHLIDLPDETYSGTTDFNAELVWQTRTPVAGPFSAQVMVDLFYK
ncbi:MULTISPECIES: fimbrial protein [unclassified Pseudomonas]|uniref:fimbrial protein n=1 Tax=unclassified Pseudomonas TaxID=196821 RepID=UPI0025FA6667|nr:MULTISPECIES: fimbrial protein [unclassified Pseudomonas]